MNGFNDANQADDLRKLYKDDKSARAVLDWFATRQNDANEIAVDRAEQMASERNEQVQHKDIVRVFRKFEEMGFGKFMVGRRGSRTRMVFDVSIRSLAAAATQKGQEPKRVDIVNAEILVDDEVSKIPHQENVTHRYQLRSDFEVRFALPQNFTTKEADRLSSFIKSLPFE